MNDQLISAYSFLPWARQGLGIYLKETDQNRDVKIRGSIDVSLLLRGKQSNGVDAEPLPIKQPLVQLYGPGDIIGIDSKAIVRTEPRHWITNFENNYLPYIEFYDEDFPWRYTPARPSEDMRQLRPWLALVVLEEEAKEFRDEPKKNSEQPLPHIVVEDALNNFPPFEQIWAWAHVHVNKALDTNIDSTDTKKLAQLLDETLQDNRDLAYSRLLCPRFLKENTAYHAFLIPSFETGRLAGLGKDPADAAFATQIKMLNLLFFRIIIAGISALARLVTSNTWYGCSSPVRSTHV
jgi:hypothetical protein